MKSLIILMLSSFLMAGCVTKPSIAPRPSTAAIGAKLDALDSSLEQARGSVRAIQGDLSTVDAKAVKIQEALRNW